MTTCKPLVPVETVARYFTVSVSTVRAWVRTGTIPRDCYVRIGNTYRFDVPKITDHFTKEHSGTTQDSDTVAPLEPEQLEMAFDDKDLDNDL